MVKRAGPGAEMTARNQVPAVWVGLDHNHVGHIKHRAIRHRQVRRLLPPMPWRRRAEYAVAGFVGAVIGIAGVAALLFGLYVFWNLIDRILHAALGG